MSVTLFLLVAGYVAYANKSDSLRREIVSNYSGFSDASKFVAELFVVY